VVDSAIGLAGGSTNFDPFIPLAGCDSHVPLQATGQSFGKEVFSLHSSVPADQAATQSSDDRLSSLLYLSQQLNAERDLHRLLGLMAREVARLLAAEQACPCGITPQTNSGLSWHSEASRCALMRAAVLREPRNVRISPWRDAILG
jgi:hypothetical protein